MALGVILILLLLVSDAFAKLAILDRAKKKLKKNSLENLPCMYSRYMLNYFNLNGIVFKHKFGVSIDDESDNSARPEELLNALDFYDKQLRSQGNIVLAMLYELRITPTSPKLILPEELMQVNLYLNNLSGTTRVHVQEAHTTEPNYVSGYKFFFKKITEALTKKVHRDCYFKTSPIVRDKAYKKPKLQAINKLLAEEWPLKTDDLSQVLSILDHNKIELEYTFQSTMNGENYNEFRPKNLLFMSLMERDVNDLNTVSNKGKSLNVANSSNELSLDTSLLPRNVITKYEINGVYASIYDLLILTRASFHQNNVISFQQHVWAAVLHPFFICIQTYLGAYKTYWGDSRYEDKFMDEGKKIGNNFKSLMDLGIFPNALQSYLKYISNSFNTLQNNVLYNWGNRQDDTNCITDGIYKLMNLYNLEFSIDDKFGVKSNNEANANDKLKFLESTINNLDLYVKSLENFKPVFKSGLAIDCHENMTESVPVDLRNTQEFGYVVVKNKIDEPLTIQLV